MSPLSAAAATGRRGGALLLAITIAACRPGVEQDAGAESGDLVEPPPPTVIDDEPNDRFDQAGDPGTGGAGEITRGDVDIYALPEAPSPRRVSLEAGRASGLTVEALHPSEALGVVPPERRRLVVGPGAALLVVRSSAERESPYVLQIEPLDLPDVGTLATEPNDEGHPVSVRFPARVAGFYDGAGDVDAVRVTGPSSERPVAAEIAPLEGHRPQLRVLGPDGAVLASVTAQRPGEGVGIPNLGTHPDGELFLEVADADGGTSSRPWTLSLHRVDLGPVGELEPNDTDLTAQRIVPVHGRFEVPGLFHQADDIDVFALPIAEESAVSVTVTPAPNTDAMLTWRRPGGDALPLDLAGPGAPEQLCAQLAQPGVHIIEVAATGVDGPLGEYRLTGTLESGELEREPNDDPGAAGVVDIRDSVRGFLATPDDVDVYRLPLIAHLDADENRRVVVAPPVGIDVAVEVLDEEGDLVVPHTDDAGPGQREEVYVPLRTITYRVVVSAGRRGGASCENAYEIRLEASR